MLILPSIFADLVGRVIVPSKDADGRSVEHEVPVQFTDGPQPLPPGMRDLLLDILSLGYPAGAAQTRLSNAPDGAIAWQCQSMLDDYASYAERAAFDTDTAVDETGWRGLEAT